MSLRESIPIESPVNVKNLFDKSEGYILGVGSKMFTVAGPVLVYGISSSVIIGIIACLFI